MFTLPLFEVVFGCPFSFKGKGVRMILPSCQLKSAATTSSGGLGIHMVIYMVI